jgi:hypothetical protein
MRPLSALLKVLLLLLLGALQLCCAARAVTSPVHIAADEQPSDDPGSLREVFTKLQSRAAYGEYLPTGTKIGWKTVELRIGDIRGREAAIIDYEYAFPSFGMQGTYTVAYELAREGAIFHAEYRGRNNDDVTSITVELDGDEMVVATDLNGRKTTQRYPRSRDTLSQRMRFYRWLYDEGRDEEIQVIVLSLERAEEGLPDLDRTAAYTFVEHRRVQHDGELVDCFRVASVDEDGKEVGSDYLAQGIPLSHSDGFIESRLEQESIAKQIEPFTGLIADAFRIPVDRALGVPSRVERLVVKLENPTPIALPESHRQRVVETLEHGLIVEIVADSLTAEEAPLTDTERAKYTGPTMFIQSDQPEIVSLAERIKSERTAAMEIANAIKFWVSTNIEQTSTADSNSALTVLRNRKGDCTEHAILFVALARALQIPARDVGGLVYTTDEELAFGWHAWAEFHDGRQWVSVDPIFHQLLVDATHIKLAGGDRDRLGPLMGRLTMEIEDFAIEDAGEDSELAELLSEMMEYEDLLPRE